MSLPALGRPIGAGLLALLVIGCAERQEPAPRETLYRYTGPGGEVVFVSDLERVPEERRGSATRVDLSERSGNRELGGDLRARGEDLVGRWLGPCGAVTVLDPIPPLSRLIGRKGALGVTLAGAFILAVAVVRLVRWTGVVVWIRAVLTLAPVVAALLLMFFTGRQLAGDPDGGCGEKRPGTLSPAGRSILDGHMDYHRSLEALDRDLSP